MNIGLQVFRAQNRLLSVFDPESAVSKAGRIFFTPKRRAAKHWEFEAEHKGHRVKLSDDTSAIVWGKGTPILLMHGWEGRATQMAGFIEPLTKAGFQLIALDAPAHGQSPGKRSHLAKFIEAIFLAQSVFGPFYAAIGHSMGAGCILYSALNGLEVEKVISIAGPSSFETVSRRFARFIGLNEPSRNRFVRHVEETVGLSFDDIDLKSHLSELKQPALIIHDIDDRAIPVRDARELTLSIPRAHLYETEGLGHNAIMRSSLTIDTVCNFILLEDNLFLDEAI